MKGIHYTYIIIHIHTTMYIHAYVYITLMIHLINIYISCISYINDKQPSPGWDIFIAKMIMSLSCSNTYFQAWASISWVFLHLGMTTGWVWFPLFHPHPRSQSPSLSMSPYPIRMKFLSLPHSHQVTSILVFVSLLFQI